MTFKGSIEEDEFRPIRVLEEQLGDQEDEEYEEKPKKLWKQKKIDMADFEKQYRPHQCFGDGVKVNWDQDDKTFKLSGTYGL
ncbi:hypothetical protein KCU81_g8315, partial [Aureobasidium melanogenum]|uniref:Uncharacterized protein n=1 Tax=Aureobasidium melanogenum (strain CBS 110374) TaxID=1043003 RepID=A0A074VJY4_AURM1